MAICLRIYHRLLENLPRILELRGDRVLKADGSYVTTGDLLCQSIIGETLSAAAPECKLLSEEAEIPADIQDSVAVVDPIDGTENFTSGLPEWGVSVSIFRGAMHRESMLALPELGRVLFTGSAVRRNASRIRGLSSSLLPEELGRLVSGPEYRISGCAVYNFYSVITGSFASFENPRGAFCWDILAGLNLSLEHGLFVEVDGRPYRGELLLPGKRYRVKIQASPEALLNPPF